MFSGLMSVTIVFGGMLFSVIISIGILFGDMMLSGILSLVYITSLHYLL